MSSRSETREMIDRAVKRFESEARRGQRDVPPRLPRVITISRQLGCGGRRVAAALGERLGWPVWDREILDVVASQSRLRYSARDFEVLDERPKGAVDDATYALLGGVSKHVYYYLLRRAIQIVAGKDAIVLGRGAHLLLTDALRVRVEASLETRVENLVRFEGLSLKAARERATQSDRDREAFLREVSVRWLPKRPERGTPLPYDLVVNTDRLNIEASTELVLVAARSHFGPSLEHRAEAAPTS